jgi:riboflavin synthase
MTIAMREPFVVEVGDSICVNGICLTAVKVSDNEFKVSLSGETLACTTARDWGVGTVVNLEPSLRVGDGLGGHFVSGHVDGVAQVLTCEKSGDSMIWEFEIPPALAHLIAPKGSVTLDGVSLTVNGVKEVTSYQSPVTSKKESLLETGDWRLRTIFSVNIIPHTAKMTGFGNLKVGDFVNLEVDMLARYVARLSEAKRA